MSVVAAVKDNDRMWVGCDSQVTNGGTKLTLTSQMKIWKPSDDNEIVMGAVGSLRDANILSIVENWIDELTKLKKTFDTKYMIKTVVPKIFSELENCGRVKNNYGMKTIDGCIIFTYKTQGYFIVDDGGALEIDDMCAIGSGSRLSLGGYKSLKDNTTMSAKEKLINIIESSCENDLYVNYPIVIMNTLDDEVEIIEKQV